MGLMGATNNSQARNLMASGSASSNAYTWGGLTNHVDAKTGGGTPLAYDTNWHMFILRVKNNAISTINIDGVSYAWIPNSTTVTNRDGLRLGQASSGTLGVVDIAFAAAYSTGLNLLPDMSSYTAWHNEVRTYFGFTGFTYT
jgi:hypothetical protein